MVKIHPSSDIQSKLIGEGTVIWQYTVILPGARIGRNCNINCHVFIENDVIVGDNVTVKPGVQLWNGLRIGNNAFIGPNVTFINDRYVRSKIEPVQREGTIVEDGATIGAGAVIMCGTRIGENSFIAAGSVVTRDVPANELWKGNPARFVRNIRFDDKIPSHKKQSH